MSLNNRKMQQIFDEQSLLQLNDNESEFGLSYLAKANDMTRA